MGGILLPTTAQTKPQGGEVVAVGEGRTVGKNKVEIGVKVISFHLLPVGYLCGFLVSEVGYMWLYRLERKLYTPNMLGQRWNSMEQSISY